MREDHERIGLPLPDDDTGRYCPMLVSRKGNPHVLSGDYQRLSTLPHRMTEIELFSHFIDTPFPTQQQNGSCQRNLP